MARLPFNPQRMAGSAGAGAQAAGATDKSAGRTIASGPSAAGAMTVSQLAALVDGVLRTHMPTPVRVIGEVSQFRDRTHWYFDIKDAEALVSCVMFQSAARRAGFVPEVGHKLLLTGRIEFYAKGGKTTLMVDKIEAIGAGALDLAFRKLCDELRGLGWFDEERKRALPMMPRKVAIVTSRTGAALQDVLDTFRRRCPSVALAMVDVRVQGAGAAAEVARAIERLGEQRDVLGVDVVLVTRGGGSKEDLWAFNERVVGEAILRCPIPVVAAIGHETDVTIAELVADVRGATPTQAAMRIAPDAQALREQLRSLMQRLGLMLKRQVQLDGERLRGAARHRIFTRPLSLVEDRRDEMESLTNRLRLAMRERARDLEECVGRVGARLERQRPSTLYAHREARLTRASERLKLALSASVQKRSAMVESAARGLDLVGPHSVLNRGYSVTLNPDGTVVRSAGAVRPGGTVRTRLADGSFDSVVSGQGSDRAVPLPIGRARRSARKPEPAKDQLDLFRPIDPGTHS